MSERLKHDTAWAGAESLLGVFAPLLREEEQFEARQMVYTHLRAILDAYEAFKAQEAARLRPSQN